MLHLKHLKSCVVKETEVENLDSDVAMEAHITQFVMENEKELKIYSKNLLLIDLLIDNCIIVVYKILLIVLCVLYGIKSNKLAYFFIIYFSRFSNYTIYFLLKVIMILSKSKNTQYLGNNSTISLRMNLRYILSINLCFQILLTKAIEITFFLN